MVWDAAFEGHYQQYPGARPSLAELARIQAEVEGHPFAEQPDVLERAAEEILAQKPDADARDVLVWAIARAAE